jgi:integrase
MARKATGTVLWYRSGFHARYWSTVAGERKRLFVDLETTNRLEAERRLAALVDADRAGQQPATVETLEQAGNRVIDLREKLGQSPRGERGYLVRWVYPAIGRMDPAVVTKHDVLVVLESVRDAGRSAETIGHVRKAVVAVFKQLRRERVVTELPIPAADEVPEALPETIDDRPKAVLSDDELLIGIAYTDPRSAERFVGPTRERQMMALLSRCVGGLRTNELHGLTWSRVRAESGRFDELEVLRTKTRRKAARRGSKAVSRQVYPLGDTVLPMFLRYWYVRHEKVAGRAPAGHEPLFPVRRARRAGEEDRVGEQRSGGTTWARAFRRDLQSAFKAAHAAGVAGVPVPGSQRWAELMEGTADRQRLIFHSSRNAAAVMAERFERLKEAAKFTGHASGRMLQHYRERVGEVDVVPVFPELLPDADRLAGVLLDWCVAEGIDPALVFRPDRMPEQANEEAHAIVTRAVHASISARGAVALKAENAEISAFGDSVPTLRRPLLYPTELRGQGQITHRFQALVVPR